MTKERPFLAEPLRFLGIPLTPPLYYLWSMSLSQVELMMHDTSVTVYPKTDTAKGSHGKERKFSRPSLSSMKEMKTKYESWDDVSNPVFDLSGFSFG